MRAENSNNPSSVAGALGEAAYDGQKDMFYGMTTVAKTVTGATGGTAFPCGYFAIGMDPIVYTPTRTIDMGNVIQSQGR